MTDQGNVSTANRTVLILFFVLAFLIVLLFLLYKILNKEAEGEYTIHRIVYKEGGVRDQVRGAALALETRLGVQLWPRGDIDEDGEEMQEVQVQEGQVKEGDSQESDSEGESQGEEKDNVEHSGKTKGTTSDTSDDDSSLEVSDGDERTTLMDKSEAMGKTGEEKEEKEEKVGDGEGKGEASGGTGLLIDLKQFSGSAIWSEEAGGEGKDIDVTPL